MLLQNISPALLANDVENINLFAFSFKLHLGFVIIATLFFIFRFFTDKKPFQLIMGIAIPFSLTIWISNDRRWFYILGIIELVFLLVAFVSSILTKDKPKEAAASAENSTAEEKAVEESAPSEEE